MARAKSAKKEALGLIERLPPAATWDEIMYELYVRQKIEAGIVAADEGRIVSHDAVKRRFVRSR